VVEEPAGDAPARIGAVVFLTRPGRPQSWLFLVFTLIAYLVTITYGDAHTTYRFSGLFLTAWAFWPATLLHLALTFPQRHGIVRRFPRVVWLPYLVRGLAPSSFRPGNMRLPAVLGRRRVLGVALILLSHGPGQHGWGPADPPAAILCAFARYVPPISTVARRSPARCPERDEATLLLPAVRAPWSACRFQRARRPSRHRPPAVTASLLATRAPSRRWTSS
jgi:hypothetical protein